MVEAVEQRMAVNAHPHKESVQFLICVEDIRCTDCWLPECKTYRFMMSDAVTQYIDAVKFVEHEGVIILALCGGKRFVWKYNEQTAPYGAILRIGKHIFPNAKLHFGKEFGMGITVIALQSPASLTDNVRAVSTTWNIEYTARLYCITEPIIAEPLNEDTVNSVPNRNLEATQQCKHLLRQIEVKSIQCHRLFGVAATGGEVSLQPFRR